MYEGFSYYTNTFIRDKGLSEYNLFYLKNVALWQLPKI